MTAYPTFPVLPGLGWSVKKTPTFSTRIATHVSGREVRAPRYARALYSFELTFEGLDATGDYAGLQVQSLQALMGFYVQCQGQFGSFLYVDPSDYQAKNASLGTSDGVNASWTAMRPLGGASEPVNYVTSLASATVGGVTAPANLWTPNTVTFAATPGGGQALAASFEFAYLCRFTTDEVEFENFMSGLWSAKSLKFRTVR